MTRPKATTWLRPSLCLLVLVSSIPLATCVRVDSELFAEDSVQSLQKTQDTDSLNRSRGMNTDCPRRHGPTPSGECEPCPENCLDCDGAFDKCDPRRCKPKYGPDSEGKCRPCPENCLACHETGAHTCDPFQCLDISSTQNPVTGLCDRVPCPMRWGRNAAGMCVLCPEKCWACDNDFSRCDPGKCEGFTGPNSEGQCVRCPENCKSCQEGAHKCDPGGCSLGHGIDPSDPEGKCVPCPEKCSSCKLGAHQCDPGGCDFMAFQHEVTGACAEACEESGHGRNSAGECVPCPENCRWCRSKGAHKCDARSCKGITKWNNVTGLCDPLSTRQ